MNNDLLLLVRVTLTAFFIAVWTWGFSKLFPGPATITFVAWLESISILSTILGVLTGTVVVFMAIWTL